MPDNQKNNTQRGSLWRESIIKPLSTTPAHKHVLYLLLITLSSIVVIFGYLVFVQPNGFLPAGFWGISVLLQMLLGLDIPLAVYLLVLNIPVLIIGWKRLDIRFAIYTLYALLLQSALLLVMADICPQYGDNLILACIFGGVFGGAGAGLIVRYHGSSGGVEVIGILIKEKFDISISTVIFAVNTLIVVITAFSKGFEIAMYTIVYMYITSTVFSAVLDGLNSKRQVTVITTKGEAVAHALVSELGRGVTIMAGIGAYSNEEKDVLMCVISRFQVARIKEIIRGVDPRSFTSIQQVYDVMGRFPRHSRPAQEPLEIATPPCAPAEERPAAGEDK